MTCRSARWHRLRNGCWSSVIQQGGKDGAKLSGGRQRQGVSNVVVRAYHHDDAAAVQAPQLEDVRLGIRPVDLFVVCQFERAHLWLEDFGDGTDIDAVVLLVDHLYVEPCIRVSTRRRRSQR